MAMTDLAGSSTAATAVTVVLFIVVLVLALLLRKSLRRAAERREEVRRLARLAAEESDLAERESVLAYCSELFPSVLHAAEVPEAPMWTPQGVVSLQEEELVEAPPPPPAAAGVCAVCFRPTTFRCKQCKAVKYCCYANVVLQCLMFTRPLTTYLLGGLHSKSCSKKAWCFMCEFERLIVERRQGKTALSPTGILSHLHEIGSNFGPGKQEDAHEFLR